jgi:hypothetical protein
MDMFSLLDQTCEKCPSRECESCMVGKYLDIADGRTSQENPLMAVNTELLNQVCEQCQPEFDTSLAKCDICSVGLTLFSKRKITERNRKAHEGSENLNVVPAT